MNPPLLRLYVDAQFTSPYAMSVFVALREKGLAFDTLTLDLDTAQNRTADFAKLSLTQRVPTLVDGDFAVSESSAITEYLQEVYPETPIYPVDPKQRARARQVQERSTLVVFYGQKMPPLSPTAEAAARKLINAAQALLVGNPANLFGEWSIADVDLAVMLNRLILNGDSVPAELVEYAQRQWQRPSVQAWVQQQRPAL